MVEVNIKEDVKLLIGTTAIMAQLAIFGPILFYILVTHEVTKDPGTILIMGAVGLIYVIFAIAVEYQMLRLAKVIVIKDHAGERG
jgi:hypothetical protein